jgi:benzoyl-CoA reductase/2-hydroxyglutaryl-CoA dehydratase subunit BcrC/BadD/HgdB
MEQEKTPMTSREMMNDMLKRHYSEARQAKEEGRLVCWSTSIAPQELLTTMDIVTLYPENHAAAIGARKDAPSFIEHTESMGYSSDLCSYARVNLAYTELLHSNSENMPLPDLLLCTSNICHTVIKWYENLSKELNIPLIMFDTPFNHTDNIQDHNAKYMKAQIYHAIEQLEEITGKNFDYDRLKEVMTISNETSEWWKKATDLAIHKPSPLNGFELFNYMAIIVFARGTEEGRTLFKLWHDELAEKAKLGIGPWKDQEEKFRVLWDGIACWPYLSHNYKTLKNLGMNVVTSTYPKSWTVTYETGDIEGMARAYSSNVYPNRNLNYDVDNLVTLTRKFGLDGIVFHSNRSCKLMDFRQYELQRRVFEECSVPSVIFDGDQTDPRLFSEAQYETRMQALAEMMQENRMKKERM